MRLFILLCGFLVSVNLFGQKIGDVVAHDPVMIKHEDTFYMFCTGFGISVYSSPDLQEWTRQKPVFAEAPTWATEKVSTYKGHTWAPDIAYYRGTYYLYYSVSAFGKNTSCIGVATNRTLDPAHPDYKWEDHGLVISSVPGISDFNAIDPNFVQDEQGQPYLAFGSFWGGLKLVKLKENGLEIEQESDILTLASQKKEATETKFMSAGGNAIEAPFIYRHTDGYYYLFASIDYCCKGKDSTYKMIVGRSSKLTGPYLDDKGMDMALGGGQLLLSGDDNWHGVGHNAVISVDGEQYVVYHGYDAHDNGKAKLKIDQLSWSSVDGWPDVRR